MRWDRTGTAPTMEETPICASVEKDLEVTVDELVTGGPVATAVPVAATPVAAAAPDGDRASEN